LAVSGQSSLIWFLWGMIDGFNVREDPGNRRKQHAVVLVHKRKLRDEIRPHLREKRQEWKSAATGHKIRISHEWVEAMTQARGRQREVKIRHKELVADHMRKMMATSEH